jgi:carbonic anhydrase/acetyltransferase-like protein (isoleucine patch superfamily)
MTEKKIHPTAIVDSNAKVGGNVEIGAFSIIGPHVTIGEQTTVQSHVVIEGEVAIGRGNFIGHGAIIGVPPQDVSFSPERKTKVEIGNDNVIREYCTIHRGSPDGSVTKIGDKNFLMSGRRSQLPDRRQCCHRQQLFTGRSCARRRRSISRWWIDLPPVHARRTIGDGAGQLCIWEGSASLRRRGRTQLRLRLEYRRNATRWTQRE